MIGCARDVESFRSSAWLLRRGCHDRRNLRLRLSSQGPWRVVTLRLPAGPATTKSACARGELMAVKRLVLAIVGAVFITGCASSSYYTVKRVDTPGTCVTTMPERDLLLGVALSG